MSNMDGVGHEEENLLDAFLVKRVTKKISMSIHVPFVASGDDS